MSIFKTPLRYPGGKQRLTNFISEILEANDITGHYCEPYAGGAGVGLRLLLTNKVEYIHLNDSDYRVYAFWHSVLNRTDELCALIEETPLTVDEWEKRSEIVWKNDKRNILDLGFSFFYLNRCNRSGIINAGVIGGNNQNGNYKIDARFKRDELITKIQEIAEQRHRILISNYDAEDYIYFYLPHLPQNSLTYLDPPYYHQGKELYLNSYKKSDHARLAGVIQRELRRNWILSYDGVSDIIQLYNRRRHFLYKYPYSAGKAYQGTEIFIFCDDIDIPHTSDIEYISEGLENLVTP
jgi:DNA adenine methylase